MGNGWEKIKLEGEAISEILVADTDRVSGAEASVVEDDFEEEKQQKQKVSAVVKTQAAGKWPITNLGTAAKKKHEYSSFCRSRKRCEKSEALHINKDISTLCVDDIFHRSYSSAGGTDQCTLPATLVENKPDLDANYLTLR